MFRNIVIFSVLVMGFNLFSEGRLQVRGAGALAKARLLADIKMSPTDELFFDIKFMEKAAGRVLPRMCLKEEAQFLCSRGEAEIHLNVGTKADADVFLGADPEESSFNKGAISCDRL